MGAFAGAETMRTAVVMLLTVALAACVSQPEGSVALMKREERRDLVLDCLSTPNRFGVPYTRAQHLEVARELPAFAPDVHLYCWRAAKILVH
jgi:hypothetical protein